LWLEQGKKIMNLIRVTLFLLASLPGLLVAQQNVVLVRGSTQVGTIQALDETAGLVVISGRRYGYDDELLSVYYDGKTVDSMILDEGLVVRYMVNNEEVVTQMELLGPDDKIRTFFEH
jgi:hypothetical protein